MTNDPSEIIFLPTILVVNLCDRASRDFIASLSPEEYQSFSEIIDWSNPNHLSRIDYFINELNLPPVFSTFPSAWILLDKEYTYSKGDRIAIVNDIIGACDQWNAEVDRVNDERILAGKSTYYQWVRNRALECMINVIVEERMMSNEYKRRYIKHQIALNMEIPVHVASALMACESVDTIHVLYYRYCKEGLLQRQSQMEYAISQETNVELNKGITLTIPPEKVALPAGLTLRTN